MLEQQPAPWVSNEVELVSNQSELVLFGTNWAPVVFRIDEAEQGLCKENAQRVFWIDEAEQLLCEKDAQREFRIDEAEQGLCGEDEQRVFRIDEAEQ